jgi:alkanesulfonate monooxygenase SsuD/methylene tetrahydromethanopterin reductase-like flavin-dependent oxidoreductase (luciferase family)
VARQKQPRIGFSVPNRLVAFGREAGSLVDLARRAEASGAFESVWVGDGLIAKPRLEPLVLLAALSQLTRAVRLGTLCLASFPLREPVLMALQLAAIDRLSRGRLVVGVCAGPGAAGGALAKAELAVFGVASEERVPRLEKAIAKVRAVWGQAEGSMGDEAPAVAPAPVQPRVPILLGTTPRAERRIEDRAIERVAKFADGWQSDALPPSRVGELWTRMRDAAANAGRADRLLEAVVHVPIILDDRRSNARQAAAAFIARNAGTGAASVTLPEGGAFGPPTLALDLLAGLIEVGATPVVRFVSDDQEGQFDRLAAEVLPQLGAWSLT